VLRDYVEIFYEEYRRICRQIEAPAVRRRYGENRTYRINNFGRPVPIENFYAPRKQAL